MKQELPILDHIPEGWRLQKNAQTAPVGYVWICNGKSRFSGEYDHAMISEDLIHGCDS